MAVTAIYSAKPERSSYPVEKNSQTKYVVLHVIRICRLLREPYKRPPEPAKKNLERKFKLRVDRKGKPSMEEVE